VAIQPCSHQGCTIVLEEAVQASLAVFACSTVIVSLALLAVSWALLTLPISVS
jgi:hypothetical protein